MKKIKALVVEDEILTARCLCEDLQDLGVNTLDPVSNAKNAVETALKEDPDLILMDIKLKGSISGIEAAKKISKKKNIPILFMTGFATDYIKEKVETIRYLGFLEKPVTIEILEPYINKLR